MAVPSARLGAVSMDHVARFHETEGPSQVDRIGRRRQVTITANMQTGYDQQSALDALWKEATAMGLNASYRVGTTGTSREMGTAAVNFGLAFLVSSGVGSGDNRAIGSVIAGGQTPGLFLTLLATLVAYSIFDDLAAKFAPRAWVARSAGKQLSATPLSPRE